MNAIKLLSAVSVLMSLSADQTGVIITDGLGNQFGVSALHPLWVTGGGGGGGNVNLVQVGGAPITLGQAPMINSLPVVIASNQSPLDVSQNGVWSVQSVQSGPWNVTALQGAPPWSVSQSGAWTVTANQGGAPWSQDLSRIGGIAYSQGQKVSAQSAPVVIASDQSPIPVSVMFPSSINTNLNEVGGLPYSEGQTVAAFSAPVVLASDQSAIPVSQNGTWTVQQGTPPWSVDQSGTWTVQSVQSGPWTVTANQGGAPWSVSQSGAWNVQAAQSGTWTVQQGSAPWSVSQSGAWTVAATQSGGWTVTANQGGAPWSTNETQIGGAAYTLGQKAMASSAPVVIASDQSSVPVTVTFPATQDVNVAKVGGSAYSEGQKAMAASAPVVIASDQTAVPVSGTVTANQGGAPWSVSQSGTWTVQQGTPPWSVSQSGAWTVTANQGGAPWSTNETQIGGAAYTLGQKTMANSAPVVLASDQSAIPASQSGSWTVTATQSGSIWKVDERKIGGVAYALGQTTMASSAPVVIASNQSAIPASQSGTWTVQQGGAPWSQNLTQVGSAAYSEGQKAMTASAPVVIASDQSSIPVTVSFPTTQDVNLAKVGGASYSEGQKAMAASAPVVIASDQSAIPVSGTVTSNQGGAPWSVSQSGTWTVQQGGAPWSTNETQIGGASYALGQTTMASSAPVVIASNQSAVPISGTVTANIGTTNGLALDATLTGGTAKDIVRGGQKGATNTNADITHTAEGADHEALDVQVYHGGVAINPTQIRALTSADVVTVTQGTAAALASAWPIKVTDGTNTMPTGDVAARAVFQQITDGTNGPVAVKAASTTPVAADKALVVAISPNSPAISTTAGVPTIATYTTTDNWTPPVSPTDAFVLTGSASKKVQVVRMSVWLINSSATGAVNTISLFKRSSLDTGGTAINVSFRTSHDSSDGAATAVAQHYTANPAALGTSVGAVKQDREFMPGSGSSGGLLVLNWNWDTNNSKPITLENANEAVYLNLGVSGSFTTAAVEVEWTEM